MWRKSTVILTPSVKVPAVISSLPCCLVIPFLLIISSLPPSFTTPENRKNRTEKKNTPRTRSRLSSLVSHLTMERSWPGFFFLALSCPFNPSLPPSPSFSFSSLSLFLFYAHLFVMFGCSFFFSSFFFFFLCLLAPILVHHVAFFNLSTHTHTYTHIYISSSRSFSL